MISSNISMFSKYYKKYKGVFKFAGLFYEAGNWDCYKFYII